MIAAFARVAVDVGAGDGHASLLRARRDPAIFAIAIDPSVDRLRDGARAALRQKLDNTLFVVSSIEALPRELHARADEVSVSFPWGSLLSGIVRATSDVLDPLAHLAKIDALVTMLLSVAPQDGRRTGLPTLDVAALAANAAAYRAAGFAIERCALASRDEVIVSASSWAKRLGHDREVIALMLRRVAA